MAYGLPQGGQRLVVPNRASKVTGREIVIPRLAYDPDRIPAAPSPWDDEFEGPLGGQWTSYGSGGSPGYDLTSVPGCLTLRQNNSGGGSSQSFGVVKPIPPMPFTVIGKLAACDAITSGSAGHNHAGLVVATASPGAALSYGMWWFNSTTSPLGFLWTNPTSINTGVGGGSASNGYSFGPPIWIKLVVVSSSNVSMYISRDGLLWTPGQTAYNPGFTIAMVGLDHHGPSGTATAFDWMRFTIP